MEMEKVISVILIKYQLSSINLMLTVRMLDDCRQPINPSAGISKLRPVNKFYQYYYPAF